RGERDRVRNRRVQGRRPRLRPACVPARSRKVHLNRTQRFPSSEVFGGRTGRTPSKGRTDYSMWIRYNGHFHRAQGGGDPGARDLTRRKMQPKKDLGRQQKKIEKPCPVSGPNCDLPIEGSREGERTFSTSPPSPAACRLGWLDMRNALAYSWAAKAGRKR